jgi:PIN domain nuclease of toxin-antitoxin system
MRLLLDTHAFLWYMAGDPQLSVNAKESIDDRSNKRHLSTASLWEMAIKYSNGKLKLIEPYELLIPRLLRVNAIKILSIKLKHTKEVANLPCPDRKHRDPFDRLIIAQSKVENIPLISIDSKFDVYGIQRVW